MEFNELQKVKRLFFAYRNGVTADVLRKGGSPFRIIFGLTVAQLGEIARTTGNNRTLAESLWNNTSTRCSMLLAPMIMPPDEFSPEQARAWCGEVFSFEVADILCMKLLSRVPYSLELARELSYGNEMHMYICIRILQRLIRLRPEAVSEIAGIMESISLTGYPEGLKAIVVQTQEMLHDGSC